MATTKPSTEDPVDEVLALSTGAGILIVALAPLAIPIVALTAVALIPLLIPLLLISLAGGLIAAAPLLVRRFLRRAAVPRAPGSRRRLRRRSSTVSPARAGD